MNVKRNIIVALTVASIGLAGVAQARNGDRDGRISRDGARSEERVKARGNNKQRLSENREQRRGTNQRGADSQRERRAVDNRRGHRDDVADRGHRKHGGYFDKRLQRRQERQIRRIRHGLYSGDLTRSEARRLKSQQRRIDRMADRYGADGYYSKGERRRLAKAQKRANKRIFDARHNDRYSYRRHHGHDNRIGSLFRDYRDY